MILYDIVVPLFSNSQGLQAGTGRLHILQYVSGESCSRQWRRLGHHHFLFHRHPNSKSHLCSIFKRHYMCIQCLNNGPTRTLNLQSKLTFVWTFLALVGLNLQIENVLVLYKLKTILKLTVKAKKPSSTLFNTCMLMLNLSMM